MSRLNIFFFGSKEIHPSDAAWFYGIYAAWTIVVCLVVLSVR
ncbi:hypothetical protein [Sporosarcina sp. FA9]